MRGILQAAETEVSASAYKAFGLDPGGRIEPDVSLETYRQAAIAVLEFAARSLDAPAQCPAVRSKDRCLCGRHETRQLYRGGDPITMNGNCYGEASPNPCLAKTACAVGLTKNFKNKAAAVCFEPAATIPAF